MLERWKNEKAKRTIAKRVKLIPNETEKCRLNIRKICTSKITSIDGGDKKRDRKEVVEK